jgi:hypothetical protein
MGSRGGRGNPDSPNSSFLKTTTSEDPRAGGMSLMVAFRGGSELGPLEASARVGSLEDKGVGGSGWAAER